MFLSLRVSNTAIYSQILTDMHACPCLQEMLKYIDEGDVVHPDVKVCMFISRQVDMTISFSTHALLCTSENV